jgi:hypothetical protein
MLFMIDQRKTVIHDRSAQNVARDGESGNSRKQLARHPGDGRRAKGGGDRTRFHSAWRIT